MQQNPYESPKEVDHRPKRSRLAVALATVALIAGGGSCGGITWYLTGIVGDIVAGDTFILVPSNEPVYAGTAGWFLGVPIGLLVAVVTWYLIGRGLWRSRP